MRRAQAKFLKSNVFTNHICDSISIVILRLLCIIRDKINEKLWDIPIFKFHHPHSLENQDSWYGRKEIQI